MPNEKSTLHIKNGYVISATLYISEYEINYDWKKITEAAFHDKKADGDVVSVTMVNEIGSFEMKTMKCLDIIELAKNCLKG